MRYAVPVAGGRIAAHFGHCEQFALFDVDELTKEIVGRKAITPPEHQPGVLPMWLAGEGVSVVIAGGIGSRAQDLFRQNHIEVVTGAPEDDPEKVVLAHLAGGLTAGNNICDH